VQNLHFPSKWRLGTVSGNPGFREPSPSLVPIPTIVSEAYVHTYVHMYSDVKFYGTTKSPGANPTIASYNASVEKIYNATNSMARFYNNNYFSLT
jgi:hypothetical protein